MTSPEYIDFAEGDIIIRQGDRDQAAYVIESGNAEVSIERPNGKIVLGVRGPGDIVGEMAIFGGACRSATVRALEPCDLRVLSQETLEKAMAEADPVLRSLVNVMAERFRQTLELIPGDDGTGEGDDSGWSTFASQA